MSSVQVRTEQSISQLLTIGDGRSILEYFADCLAKQELEKCATLIKCVEKCGDEFFDQIELQVYRIYKIKYYERSLDFVEVRDFLMKFLQMESSLNVMQLLYYADFLYNDGLYNYCRQVLKCILKKDPKSIEAHNYFGIVSLLQEDFSRGWVEFFNYRSRPERPPFSRNLPQWRGEQTKSLLLSTEKGLGDSIHFMRYLPLAKKRVERLVVICQPQVKSLISRLGCVDQIYSYGEEISPCCEKFTYLLDLAAIFWTTLDAIPSSKKAYIDPSESLWKSRLQLITDLKVGVCWRGGSFTPRDFERSVSLERFGALLDLPNATYFSLQVGVGQKEIAQNNFQDKIVDWTGEFNLSSFDDAAAFISNLDLVITVDTAIAHLAAALGKPTWILIYYSPDWRWFLNRNDSPWYSSVRLFRQKRRGDWESVIQDVVTAFLDRTY